MMNLSIGNIKKAGLIKFLGSTESFGNTPRSIASISILLIWLTLVIYVSAYHELWRSEVRSLTIALEPAWFWELPSALSDEGHPLLWYFMVRLAYWFVNSPLTLQILSISIAFVSVFIFFRYAPFPVWQKILFLGGVLPLYEYAVKCRHYGISMLLFFLFAALYKHRKERPILLACVLMALANTNVNACMLTGLLVSIWFIDDIIVAWHMLDRNKIIQYTYAFGLVGAGILCSIFVTMPTQDGIVTDARSLQFDDLMTSFILQFKYPARLFADVFPHWLSSFRNELVWVLILGLLVRLHLSVMLYLGITLVGMLFYSVYPGALRHQGVIIIFIITLYWIAVDQKTIFIEGKLKSYLSIFHRGVIYSILTLIFVAHISSSVDLVSEDISYAMSSSKSFGEFLESHETYQNAIIMSDPDYLLDSLPYYASNQIYIPRERRFGKRVLVTTLNQQSLSIRELLEIARQVKKDEGKPVLIVLGHLALSDKKTDRIRYPYNRVFTWSPEELAFFKANTTNVITFDQAVTDENYEIYLVH